MNFLNVDYLKNLEKKYNDNINYIFDSFGGGSTLIYIFVVIFIFSLLIMAIEEEERDFLFRMYKIKRNIKEEKLNLNKLKKYKNNLENENTLRLNKLNITEDKKYQFLFSNYKNSKVSFWKKIIFYSLLPLFYIISFDEDSNGRVIFLHFILSFIFLFVGIGIGISNFIEEEITYNHITENVFNVEGTPIKYPIIYYKKESNYYKFYYLDGNDIKNISYEGVVHMDSNLAIDNNSLKDEVFVVDSDLDIDSSILAEKKIFGYLEADSYDSFINEYKHFKKENKDFLKSSIFYDSIEDLVDSLENNFEVKNVILKSY